MPMALAAYNARLRYGNIRLSKFKYVATGRLYVVHSPLDTLMVSARRERIVPKKQRLKFLRSAQNSV